MPGFSRDRWPQPLAEALQRVPAVLVQDPATAVLQLGKVYLNLPKLLGNCQLTERQLQRLLQLVLRKDITHSQLVNNFQDEQQQPDQQQSAGAAVPAANQQPDTVEAAAASAQQPGMLPWHTLILNQQPLGIEGLAQLFQQLIPTLKSRATQRLRTLAASGCNISGSLSDLVLQPLMAANYHCYPEWVGHLQWLDLSHNPQLLAPENWDQADPLWLFLAAARELRGLCLQYTGLTSIQLHNLLTAMDRLLHEDDQPGSSTSTDSDTDSGRRSLCNLQCLKVGPISPDPDVSSAAAGTTSSSSHQISGWPTAAFEDLFQRLADFVPPFNKLKVLELHGLSQQQQQHIVDWADNTSAQSRPHVAQPQPDCCRISWLEPGQPLVFEVPVSGFDYDLPPPQPVQSATPVAAEPGFDSEAHTAAMQFAMPAGAVWPFAAGSGWTFPPPPPPAAAGGGGGAAAVGGGGAAGAGGFRPRQPQQAATARASAAAVGTKSVVDVLGRPSSFAHDFGRQHRIAVPLAAAAAAAGDVPRAAQQHTSERQQQPRQRRDRQQQRVVRRAAWQLGITDYADQWAYDAAAMDEDWQQQHEQQQQQQQHDIPAVAAYSDVDDDFMDSGNSRQRQRRQRRSPSLVAAAAAAGDDQGIVLGSQDTDGAATGCSSRARDGGILAGLIKQHRDDLFSESDNDDQLFVFAALRTSGQDDEVLRMGAGRELCQQQQPIRRKRKKRTLQPMKFDAYASSPAAAAGYGSPAHKLSPLDSPLSDTGLEHSPPNSWQQQGSMDSPAAAAASTEDEDDAAPDQYDPDLDAALDKFLAEEDDDDRHGVYSQDEASQDRGSQGQGNGTLQQRQRRGSGDDDDPEELRAFYFEKTKLQGQGLGPKGQQLFGLANEGEKRRHKTGIDDKAQQTLQQLRSRYEQQQPSGDQAAGQAQPLQGQPRGVGASSGGTVQGVQSREAKITGAMKVGKNHRRSKGGRNRFVDDAAGGGGAYGYEEELLTGSSSNSSEDGRGSDPPARQRRITKSPKAENHGAAAADQVIQDYDGGTAADDGDEPLVPTAAAAVRGSSKHRSRVAVLDSEPQDEPDPLDAVLQQHFEQQQQRCQETGEADYAGRGGGSSRKSRIAMLDSEPQEEPDLPDAMLQQHYEQQQQQQPGQLNPAPADRSKGGNLASKAVQRSISKKHTTKEATTCASRRQRRSVDRRVPGAVLTAQTAAATAGPHQPVCRRSHGNAESSPQPVDDEAADQPGDLNSIPEYRQWQEAEAELTRLQEAELQLQQEIQAAQATAAAAAAAAAPEAALPAPLAATVTAGARAVCEKTTPSAGLLADGEVGVAADVTATRGAAVAVAVDAAGDRVNSLQQQLKSVTDDRKRQQRLARFLKGNVPWHWDKRGPEACSFQINKLQDSKRQSRAPTRLSPGAIEQQERLMRLAQQQQQQQQREAVPVQSAAAERTATLPARKVGSGTKSAPTSTHRDLEMDSESASSGCSSSSWSDSQDDVPLATLYQQRRHSSTQPASPAGDTTEPKGCCPGEADANGAHSSDVNDRLGVQQHQQQSGGETGAQRVPAVAAAAARDRQATQPPAYTAAVTAAGGDGSGGRRRTSRMTAGKASKEFSKVFGSDYYTAGMPLPAAAAGAAKGSSFAAAAAESGQADAFDSVNATGLEPAALAKIACPLPVSAAIVSQQQQHQDCVTTVPVTAAAAAAAADACATTAAAVAQHTSSQPGHNVVVDGLHKAQEPSASALQLASAQVQPGQQLQQQQPQDNVAQHSSQQQQQHDIISQNSSQQQQPQQPQDLLPQQCSQQQQQENTEQQHQLDPESSAACAGQGVSGVTDILQGPTAQAQQRQAPGRHQIAPHAPESAATAVKLRDSGQSAADAPSLASDAAPTAAVREGAISPAVIQQAQLVVEAAAAVQTVVCEPPVPHAAVEVAVGSVAASPGASLGEEPPELEIPDSEEGE